MFNDKIKLPSLVGDVDDMGHILRNLIRAVHDHGGDTAVLNRLLLQDAITYGAPTLYAQMAKLIIGHIWRLTEFERATPLAPGFTEFSDTELMERYSNVRLGPNVLNKQHEWFSYKPPTGSCVYRLAHLGSQELTYEEVLGADVGPNSEHGCWKEGFAYGALLDPRWVGNCCIAIMGSQLLHQRGLMPGEALDAVYPIFPVLYAAHGRIEMWSKDARKDNKFGPATFYLVRDY